MAGHVISAQGGAVVASLSSVASWHLGRMITGCMATAPLQCIFCIKATCCAGDVVICSPEPWLAWQRCK